MPSSSYDLIVLGDDFAGLVTATLAVRRGLRVLLLVSGNDVASYQLGPYRLPTRPLVLPGWEMGASKRVIDELHFQHPVKRKLDYEQTPFQFVGEDVRLDVAKDEVLLGRELGREFGDDGTANEICDRAEKIARALEPLFEQDIAVPPSGFWERRETGRMEEQFSQAADRWWSASEGRDDLRALLAAPAALATSLYPDTVSPQAIARCFASWRSGCPRLRGDWQTLREVFLDKFASHNGEVRVGAPQSITVSWGKITGIQLDDGDELGLAQLALASPLDVFASLVGAKVARKLKPHLDAVALGGYRYVLNLVVHESGIPEGMANEVFYVNDSTKPLTGANALAIHVAAPDDEARVVVTVEAACPVLDDVGTDAAFADLRVQIRQRLESVMPFFSEHILAVHSPNEAAAAEGLDGELELKEAVAATPLWRCTLDSTLGLSALPYQIGIKNLTLASAQVLPGMGLEGDFATGWCAAKLIVQAAGKKRDVARGQVIGS